MNGKRPHLRPWDLCGLRRRSVPLHLSTRNGGESAARAWRARSGERTEIMRSRTCKLGTLCLVGGIAVAGCGGHAVHEDGEEADLALSGNASIQAVHSGLCADVIG